MTVVDSRVEDSMEVGSIDVVSLYSVVIIVVVVVLIVDVVGHSPPAVVSLKSSTFKPVSREN